MDSTDLKIISMLKKNARVSASAISKEVGLAVSSVTERIRRLERSGVILQYTAIVDESKVEGGVNAIICIKVDLERFDALADAISNNPNVVTFYILTGEFDFMATISATSADEFRRVHHSIMNLKGVNQVKTYYIFGTKSEKSSDA